MRTSSCKRNKLKENNKPRNVCSTGMAGTYEFSREAFHTLVEKRGSSQGGKRDAPAVPARPSGGGCLPRVTRASGPGRVLPSSRRHLGEGCEEVERGATYEGGDRVRDTPELAGAGGLLPPGLKAGPDRRSQSQGPGGGIARAAEGHDPPPPADPTD